MSATNTVAWFEIGAPDIDAAEAFYGPLFGWSFALDGPYTLITAAGAPGPSGGIFNTGGNILPYAVFVVRVADVATTGAAPWPGSERSGHTGTVTLGRRAGRPLLARRWRFSAARSARWFCIRRRCSPEPRSRRGCSTGTSW